jgi:3-hydroxymyristoyl/3-hydroxydecanoyl-(acyl carrier protein) dehydratase
VVPGDKLIIKTSILKRKGKVYKLESRAYVEGKLVTEANLMASFG